MTFLEITTEDKGRLKRLNSDKGTMFALKKLFMNVCTDKLGDYSSTEMLAAKRIAIEYIRQAFHELSIIRPEDVTMEDSENPAV